MIMNRIVPILLFVVVFANIAFAQNLLSGVEDETISRFEAQAQTSPDTILPQAQDMKDNLESVLLRLQTSADPYLRDEQTYRRLAENAGRAAAEAEDNAQHHTELSLQEDISEERKAFLEEQVQFFRERVDFEKQTQEGHLKSASDARAQAEGTLDQITKTEEYLVRLEAVIAQAEDEIARRAQAVADENEAARQHAQDEVNRKASLWRLQIHDVLGRWQPAEAQAEEFALHIVQADPEDEAHPYRLQAHTDSRVWEGNYSEAAGFDDMASQNARMVFTYKPIAGEMNPNVPMWARLQVEGQLEWRLELNEAGTPSDPMLVMHWHRPLIRWRANEEQTEGTAQIVADDEPRRYELKRTTLLSMRSQSMPVLLVGVDDPSYDWLNATPEALIKGQRFRIRLLVPGDIANEYAANPPVIQVRGMDGGAATTVTLDKRNVFPGDRWVFTHDGEVTIADDLDYDETDRDPQLFSIPWIMQNTLGQFIGGRGARLSLDVENGESIEVSYQGAHIQIPIYNTIVQRGLVQQEQGVARVKMVMQAVAQDNDPATDSEAAQRALRKLQNYEAMMAHEGMTDIHRFQLGRLYMGIPSADGTPLMYVNDELLPAAHDPQRRFFDQSANSEQGIVNPLMRAALEGFGADFSNANLEAMRGVDWVSTYEAHRVLEELHRTSNDFLNENVERLYQQATLGAYDGVVAASGAGDYFIIFSDVDPFGQPVHEVERILSVINALQNLSFKMPKTVTQVDDYMLGPLKRWRAIEARHAKRKSLKASGDIVDGPGEDIFSPEIPESLTLPQHQQIYLDTLEPDNFARQADLVGGSAHVNFIRRQDIVDTPDDDLITGYLDVRTGDPRFYDGDALPQPDHDSAAIDVMYENKGHLLGGGRVFTPQRTGETSCRLMGVNQALFETHGIYISELDSYKRYIQTAVLESTQTPAEAQRVLLRFWNSRQGIEYGHKPEMLMSYINSYGGQVQIPNPANNKSVNLRDLLALRERSGYEVQIGVNAKTQDGRTFQHAIQLKGMETFRGQPLVKFYDPMVGQNVLMKFEDLDKIIARNINDGQGSNDYLSPAWFAFKF